MNEKSIVLVTGGTGFTGSFVLRKLSKIGCEIRAIHRKTSNISAFEGLDIKWYEGNVYDEDLIKAACSGVTHILHVAAAFRQPGIKDEEYHNVHVKSTKILANEALKQPNFEKFVHVSTIGVLGHIENPPADETTEYNPGDIYQVTKTEADQWILDFSKNNKLPMTVVRPAGIYGPGDKRLLKLFKMAKLPLIPLLGFTKGLYHLIHVEDLADFIIYCAGNSKINGKIYICGSKKATSIKEMLSIISEHNGKKPRFIRIPVSPIFVLADICEFICKKINVEPPIYRRRVAFFTKDRSFKTERMFSDAEFTPRISDKEGLVKLADWYKEQNWL